MTDVEKKIAALEKELAEQKEQLARVRGEPHKSVVDWKWQPIDYTAGMSMGPSAIRKMAEAVPDTVIRDLVGDVRRGDAHRIVPQSPSPERGTGWAPDTPFPDRSREFELMDRIVESQVGGANDTRKLK